jgi:hypothetical protein
MKYTPSTLTAPDLFFTIPIYQRLFEWSVEHIDTLLSDLKKEYKQTDGTGDYYIGMLTATQAHELVDGQQRFTVMMLLGSVLQTYDEAWTEFLVPNQKVRLAFSSRPNDDLYLLSLIEQSTSGSPSYQNLMMKNAHQRIIAFMDTEDFCSEEDKKAFAKYVYEHLSFFISTLPAAYSPRALNKYFERMNTSGKNLEQHEILKVKLLSNLENSIDTYMELWNKLSDMDTPLIRRREGNDPLSERKSKALRADIATIISQKLINGSLDAGEEDETTIDAIKSSATAPKEEHRSNQDVRGILSFPYLLLLVLHRMLPRSEKDKISLKEFFNPAHLISTFEHHLPFHGKDVDKVRIQEFMEQLVRARLALDICFVRLTDTGYTLDMNMSEDESAQSELLMFQSMLYVSSSNYTHYRWFGMLMDEVDQQGLPEAQKLYQSLRRRADTMFTLPSYTELTYGGDNRYWFWRLDFHIWEHRKELLQRKTSAEGTPEELDIALRIAEQYVFRRNRSIEHVAPQHPQTNSSMSWEETEKDAQLRDSFGNLVMISQGLNSCLKNESYEVKKAHVQAYCNSSKTGSIESLKLLMLHLDYPNTWTRKSIEEHGHKMYELLKEACHVAE